MPRGVNQYDESRIQERNVADASSANIVSPGLVIDGLVLNLDAGNFASYPATGTSWFDVSNNLNDGVLTGGPTYSASTGGEIVFDGTNDYVNLGDKFSVNEGTVDFWIKSAVTIDSGTTANYRPLGKSDLYEIRWNVIAGAPVGTLCFDWGAGNDLVSTRATWTGGVWYSIVFTWSVSQNKSNLYVQSVLDSTGIANSIAGQTGNLSLGASRGGAQGFINGSISSFKIYNRPLLPGEVEQNFNATRSRFGV